MEFQYYFKCPFSSCIDQLVSVQPLSNTRATFPKCSALLSTRPLPVEPPLAASKQKKQNTSLSVCVCLPSKPVVSHTQASSKNGLFHLTQVMTAAPAAAAVAAAADVWPKHPPNLPRPLSSRSAFIPTRMDKFSRPPILHRSSSILLCCRLRPAPSLPPPFPPSLSWLQIWWQWMSFSPHWVLGRLSSPIK